MLIELPQQLSSIEIRLTKVSTIYRCVTIRGLKVKGVLGYFSKIEEFLLDKGVTELKHYIFLGSKILCRFSACLRLFQAVK